MTNRYIRDDWETNVSVMYNGYGEGIWSIDFKDSLGNVGHSIRFITDKQISEIIRQVEHLRSSRIK